VSSGYSTRASPEIAGRNRREKPGKNPNIDTHNSKTKNNKLNTQRHARQVANMISLTTK
jgi:hypothetical protein